MIARLNGSPFTSIKGDLKIDRKNAVKSVNVFWNEAIRKAPITAVDKQVNANKTTLTHGNFCCGASSNSISAEGLNVLSMKPIFLFSVGPSVWAASYRACAWRGQPISLHRFVAFWIGQWPVPPRLKRLQVLARLEAYGFSRRDVNFGTFSRLSADTRFPRLHRKYSKAAQLAPVLGLPGIPHAL